MVTWWGAGGDFVFFRVWLGFAGFWPVFGGELEGVKSANSVAGEGIKVAGVLLGGRG